MASDQVNGRLYACGFNAFGQLVPNTHEDVYTLHELSESVDTKLLFSGWCETAVFNAKTPPEGRLIRYGSAVKEFTLPVSDPVLGVGDHNGVLVILDAEGCVNFVEQLEDDGEAHHSNTYTSDEHPRIAHLAMVGSGRVAAVTIQQNDRILEFSSFGQFRKWCTQSDTDDAIITQHTLPSQVTQLVANATGFACLTRSGDVYTWGDARHGLLGRSTEAQHPGPVESLTGLKIVKIASRGWITAALSADGAAYLFGAATPGSEDSIGCLRDLDSDHVALVDIVDGGEPLDVLDVAVGDAHAVLLVEGGRVFVVGENRNGQLGLGDGSAGFVEQWTEVEVPNGRRSVAVYAGPKCSFVTVEE